jgi:hypothetical protein
MKSVNLGQASINPARDDFFRKVVEGRKGKKKSDPLYYFLKIVASAGCYGIYAEVNRVQTGKNDAKQIQIFSGEISTTERTCIVETLRLLHVRWVLIPRLASCTWVHLTGIHSHAI